MIVAKYWKMQGKITFDDWIVQVRRMSLMNKLTAIHRFRMGNLAAIKDYELEWYCFIKSKYGQVKESVRQYLLSIM